MDMCRIAIGGVWNVEDQHQNRDYLSAYGGTSSVYSATTAGSALLVNATMVSSTGSDRPIADLGAVGSVTASLTGSPAAASPREWGGRAASVATSKYRFTGRQQCHLRIGCRNNANSELDGCFPTGGKATPVLPPDPPLPSPQRLWSPLVGRSRCLVSLERE